MALKKLNQARQDTEEFIYHFLDVEKRIPSFPRKLLFIFRFLRYVFHHYRLMPDWLKTTKIIIIIVALFAQPYWQSHLMKQELSTYYQQYYPYYYQHFQKAFSDEKAAEYARKYATHYAYYYVSDDYRNAKRRALPSPEEIRNDPAFRSLRAGEITPNTVVLIKEFEGLSLKPYRDSGGAYTIGYGHLIRSDEHFTSITKQQAETLLLQDIVAAATILNREVKQPLTRHERGALISLIFNIGSYQFKTSTLRKLLNQGDMRRAATEFHRWNKVDGRIIKGLARRRQAEYRLFTGALNGA